MVNSVNSPSVLLTNILPSCAFITWSTKFRPSPKPEAPFLRLRLAAAARSYFWKMLVGFGYAQPIVAYFQDGVAFAFFRRDVYFHTLLGVFDGIVNQIA